MSSFNERTLPRTLLSLRDTMGMRGARFLISDLIISWRKLTLDKIIEGSDKCNDENKQADDKEQLVKGRGKLVWIEKLFTPGQ